MEFEVRIRIRRKETGTAYIERSVMTHGMTFAEASMMLAGLNMSEFEMLEYIDSIEPECEVSDDGVEE